MSRNLDGRVEKLERTRGVHQKGSDPRDYTTEELMDMLIEYGLPVYHGMPDEELMPILDRAIAEEQRKRHE